MTNTRDVFESVGNLYDGSANPNKVFANTNVSDEAERCETEGILKCNSDPNCKMLNYYYNDSSRQSMCTLMKYKSGKDFSDIDFRNQETSSIYWAKNKLPD